MATSTALLQRLLANSAAQPNHAMPAASSPVPNPRRRPLDGDPLDITQARSSAEFMRCLSQPMPNDPHVLPSFRKPPPLPKFTGDIREWPQFITTFVETTKALRISDVENVARLQAALSGKAAEAVKGHLL